jgi:hypothetical protein
MEILGFSSASAHRGITSSSSRGRIGIPSVHRELLHPEWRHPPAVIQSIFSYARFAHPLDSDASRQMPETSPSAFYVSTLYHHSLLIGWATSARLSESFQWLRPVMIGAQSQTTKELSPLCFEPRNHMPLKNERTYARDSPLLIEGREVK